MTENNGDVADWELVEYHLDGDVRREVGYATFKDGVVRVWYNIDYTPDPDCRYQLVERLDGWSRPVPDREPNATFASDPDATFGAAFGSEERDD